jgi:hypothetical protein
LSADENDSADEDTSLDLPHGRTKLQCFSADRGSRSVCP